MESSTSLDFIDSCPIPVRHWALLVMHGLLASAFVSCFQLHSSKLASWQGWGGGLCVEYGYSFGLGTSGRLDKVRIALLIYSRTEI